MKRLLASVFFLLFSGCTSIPLSTIVQMSTFDGDDFVALDPQALRVKITLLKGFELNTRQSWLGIGLSSPAGELREVFRLKKESIVSHVKSSGMFSPPEQVISYTLSLRPASREKFIKLQAFFDKAPPDEVDIRVVPKLASYPETAKSVKTWIELQLNYKDGFFSLIDGAELSLKKLSGK